METKPTTCPHCGHEMTPAEIASLMRKLPSEKRTAASRTNGKLGGRPKGSKNKPKETTVADSSFLHEGDDVYLNGEKLRIVKIEGNTITTKGRYEPIDS